MFTPSHPSRRRYTVPGDIAPHIRFDVDWIEAEKRILQSAISDAERLNSSATARDRPGRGCATRRLSGITAYMAHCGGWDYVLFAFSVAELGLKMLFVRWGTAERAGGLYCVRLHVLRSSIGKSPDPVISLSPR